MAIFRDDFSCRSCLRTFQVVSDIPDEDIRNEVDPEQYAADLRMGIFAEAVLEHSVWCEPLRKAATPRPIEVC